MSFSQFMKKILMVAALVSISSASLADWDVQKVYVRKVEQFQEGNSVTRVIYEVVAGSSKGNFSCSPNDTEIVGLPDHYQASFWNSSATTLHQILVGQLLAAQAQDAPVDLYFENSGCDTNTNYGHGGRGRKMMGVSVGKNN